MSLLSGKRVALDASCADAVDLARAALDEVAEAGTVGEHLGAEPESERVVVHSFAADLPGYVGWRWAVTVMRASRSKSVTIGETVLLPGADSLLPPAWVPWTERLRPGDLGVGDLLPTDEDDPRLEPGWNASERVAGGGAAFDSDHPAHEHGVDIGAEVGAGPGLGEARATAADGELGESWDAGFDDGWVDTDAGRAVAIELDLIRPRVLSPIGLDDAVDRWLAGDQGPQSAMAQSAPATCATCGFRITLRGSLGHAFGVCANEISPSDGRVVALDHGCGAHSEAVVVPSMAERAEPVIDEVGFETVDREPLVEGDPEPVGELESAGEPVSAAEAETLAESVVEPVVEPAPTDESDPAVVSESAGEPDLA